MENMCKLDKNFFRAFITLAFSLCSLLTAYSASAETICRRGGYYAGPSGKHFLLNEKSNLAFFVTEKKSDNFIQIDGVRHYEKKLEIGAQCDPSTGKSLGSSSEAAPENKSLNTMWLGKWQSTTDKTTLDITTNKIKRFGMRADKTPYTSEFSWVGSEDEWKLKESQFTYTKRITTAADLLKKYEESLAKYNRDPSDFRVSDPKVTREAIRSLSAGNYKVLRGYSGGDCGVYDWIVDKDQLLAVTLCNYRHEVQLFKRIK
jgi:hypothetical protein